MSYILVVDDEYQTAKSLSNILTRLGHTVDMAKDGNEMFQLAMVNNYNLVIADIVMPDCRGDSAAKLLRVGGCPTPIISVTGLSDDEVKNVRSRFLYLCHKPVNIDVLLPIINEILSRPADADDNEDCED